VHRLASRGGRKRGRAREGIQAPHRCGGLPPLSCAAETVLVSPRGRPGGQCLYPVAVAARIWLLKVLIDTVLRGHRPDLLVAVAGGFVVIAVARRVLTFVEDKLSGTVGTRVVRDLRVTVYTHLQGLSLRYFHRHRLGDLLTRLSGDIAAIEDLLVTGLSTISGLAQATGYSYGFIRDLLTPADATLRRPGNPRRRAPTR